MKRILLCVDGSNYTKTACNYAKWLAKKTDAHVNVLYVSDLRQFELSMISDFSGSLGVQPYESLYIQLQNIEKEKTEHIKSYVEKLLKPIEGRFTFHQKTGIIVDILKEFEDSEEGVDLIMLGKRGECSEFSSDHLGSTMERIVRSSSKPCFVCPKEFNEIKTLLIAYDGSNSINKAIQFLTRSQEIKDIKVHLLSVLESNESEEITNNSQKVEEILKENFYNVKRVSTEGEPEDVIPAYIENNKIDLLLMGAYGHSTIRHLFIGSTTTNLLRSCNVPTLMFR